jgi:uncharacterized protein YwqG
MDKKQAVETIRDSHLGDAADLLIERLLPSARIIVANDPTESMTELESSCFGGLPPLPPGVTWPVWDRTELLKADIARRELEFRDKPIPRGMARIIAEMREELSAGPKPLLFLAQMSLKQLGAAAPILGWPCEGTLLFFCDPSDWGYDPLARGHCRVFHIPNGEKVIPTSAPRNLPDDSRFRRYLLNFKAEWTLPTQIDDDGIELSTWRNEDYRELCRHLIGVENHQSPIHRCGGHPQQIQSDMQLECQLVADGLYCGNSTGYQDPRRATLEKSAADWRLLLQIDSDEDRLGWMWGDLGRVYFWARRQDIEAGDFSGAWSITQCH